MPTETTKTVAPSVEGPSLDSWLTQFDMVALRLVEPPPPTPQRQPEPTEIVDLEVDREIGSTLGFPQEEEVAVEGEEDAPHEDETPPKS